MEAKKPPCPPSTDDQNPVTHSHRVTQKRGLPKHLVGSKCTANVNVGGVDCSCLLDTGSQVTTVAKSFYQTHLSDHPIKPISNILEVEGANGQPVPYLGYVEVNLKFPRALLESEPEISTLALIIPDLRSNSDVPLLIGTNTLDPLYDQCCDEFSLSHNSSCYGYRRVLRTLQLRKKQATSGELGFLKLRGREQAVLPAKQRVPLEGYMCVNSVNTEKCALIEQPSRSTLPGGVFVDCCLISLPEHGSNKLPVFLRNETEHDIILPTNCVIADLTVADTVIENHLVDRGGQKHVVDCSTHQAETCPGKSFDFGPSLPEQWKERVTLKLNTFSDVFAQHDLDFGHATKIQHHIKLKDETPIKQRPRPIHPRDYEAVKKHLKTLLDAGVIRESESPFSSPIVVVRKKNGDVRLCVDYRKLNLQTIKDSYALPNLEESFSALAGSKWFSVMDLKSGYYQIEMNESDKPKTAFVCPFGFWEFNRMPQGVTNAPSTFQRLMEKCMSDIHLKEVLVFLDDLIVFSDTLEEHESRLIHVLNRLKEYGLKLSPDKCKFFQTSVRYLGHIVSSDGVKTDPEKVQALKTWPRPQNLKELQSFLGFSGYYRRFVKDYSRIVKPLTHLTTGYPPRRKGVKISLSDGKYLSPKEPFGERWGTECQQAFEAIIHKLTSSPVLGYADPRLPYVLHTDASTTGLGAALYQEQNGKLRVIAYASRGLSCSEARYPAHKLEFLALKWAITEKFHDYLYGNSFTVITDNNPLTYLLTTAKLDAASYRWLAALSTFTFDIKYRAGKQNMDADGLSRRDHGALENDATSQEESQRIDQFTSQLLTSINEFELVTPEIVKAACQRHTVRQDQELSPFLGYVESLAIHADAIPAVFEEDESQDGILTVPKYSESDLMKLQREDPGISKVISLVESNNLPADHTADSPEEQLILREWKRLHLKSGLLYRTRECEGQTLFQLVLPNVLRPIVLRNLHDDMGHLGIERTLELTRSRFYWPKMAADVERKVKTCERCVRRKTQPDKAAPLVNIQTTRPMELVCMDFLSLEPDSHNTKDILVITDHFTKYAVAIPTRDQKASTVAKTLWEHFLGHYGFPERLHSDQGRDFESHTIKELCALAGIRKVRTSPYHPRGNPVERYNRTLLSMLGTLKDKEKIQWRDHVKPLTHAYNCTRNDVTGFSPYELMFGRQPRLPIDLAFGLPVKGKESSSHSQYVRNLKSHLEESYQVAIENSRKVAEKNKRRFDRVVRESTLAVGDRVLVRNLRLRNKHKLADRWEPMIYVVTKQMGGLPVYSVKPEKEEGPPRTLHRDLLLPCGFLPETEREEQKMKSSPKRPRTRQQSAIQQDEEPFAADDDTCGSWNATAALPDVKDRRVVKMYDIPRHNPAPALGNHSQSPENPHPYQVNADSAPGAVRPSDGLQCEKEIRSNACDSFLREAEEEEAVRHSKAPTPKEAGNSPETEPGNSPETEAGKSPEKEAGNSLGMENQNSPEMETQNVPGDLPDTSLKPVEGSLVEPEAKDHTEAEVPTQEKTEGPTEAGIPVRRSLRQREPSRRFHYPELGNPLVSVVTSLFQGLSTALTNSLNNNASRDWLTNIPLEMAETVVTQQPFTDATGRAYI